MLLLTPEGNVLALKPAPSDAILFLLPFINFFVVVVVTHEWIKRGRTVVMEHRDVT